MNSGPSLTLTVILTIRRMRHGIYLLCTANLLYQLMYFQLPISRDAFWGKESASPMQGTTNHYVN